MGLSLKSDFRLDCTVEQDLSCRSTLLLGMKALSRSVLAVQGQVVLQHEEDHLVHGGEHVQDEALLAVRAHAEFRPDR